MMYDNTGAFFRMLMTFSSATMSMNDVGVPSAPIFTFSPDSGFPTYGLIALLTSFMISYERSVAIFLS